MAKQIGVINSPKPGYRTSEFYIALAVVLFPLAQGVLTGSMDWQVALGSAITAVAYAISRSKIKA